MINIKYCEDCGERYEGYECLKCKEQRGEIMEVKKNDKA